MSNLKIVKEPINRKNLHDLSNRVHSLKSAITYKIELETIIALQEKLLKSLLKSPILLIIFSAVSRVIREKIINRKLLHSKIRMKIEVDLKQRNIYHRNEMEIEQSFSEIYDEMDNYFESYYSQLLFIYKSNDHKETIPYKDVCMLVNKHQNNPPKIKTDKLSFFLSMEKTLYTCNHPE